ncbi:hypothetical protein D5018_11750 [Parashewanella curva]|uniref:Uncharacterized protein n=1 Tax=Parashewanella curva TaxID=2338552 RepID=A0A3L8PVS6_9GAMM|nr:hypothetical protein [Parashewanella curva]RLV59537.1 hypothetical protein D5018_11750 [Parashewanella curva]
MTTDRITAGQALNNLPAQVDNSSDSTIYDDGYVVTKPSKNVPIELFHQQPTPDPDPWTQEDCLLCCGLTCCFVSWLIVVPAVGCGLLEKCLTRLFDDEVRPVDRQGITPNVKKIEKPNPNSKVKSQLKIVTEPNRSLQQQSAPPPIIPTEPAHVRRTITVQADVEPQVPELSVSQSMRELQSQESTRELTGGKLDYIELLNRIRELPFPEFLRTERGFELWVESITKTSLQAKNVVNVIIRDGAAADTQSAATMVSQSEIEHWKPVVTEVCLQVLSERGIKLTDNDSSDSEYSTTSSYKSL